MGDYGVFPSCSVVKPRYRRDLLGHPQIFTAARGDHQEIGQGGHGLLAAGMGWVVEVGG
jgi:hypothetical protein